MAIDTSKVKKPGAVATPGGITKGLISDLQLLTPQVYKQYVEKYGNEEFFMWLETYAGKELVKNGEFSHWESRGKLMAGISPNANVATPAVGGTITVTIAAADHFASGKKSPGRVGESGRIASSNVEFEIIAKNTAVDSAHTINIRPKRADKALISAGSADLLATDVLLMAGQMDAGEASDSIDPLDFPDEKITGYTTEMRESFKATDRSEMTEVYYEGVSGKVPKGGDLAGNGLYTLKGLIKTNRAFLNHVENKLMRGDLVTNTGLNTTTSKGTRGFIPTVVEDAPLLSYANLDVAKMHEITRIMDVQGCTAENMWLMDIYQTQAFSDDLFSLFPAGSWVWGKNENSKEAALNYGVQSFAIDNYLFNKKKYKYFNAEAVVGKAPATDFTRDFGVICPMGTTKTAKTEQGDYIKNLTIMYEQPVGGGTVDNGIRVWQHGGGSKKATNGKMVDQVEMIAYKGLRFAAVNQFLVVKK